MGLNNIPEATEVSDSSDAVDLCVPVESTVDIVAAKNIIHNADQYGCMLYHFGCSCAFLAGHYNVLLTGPD